MKKVDCTRKEAKMRLIREQVSLFSAHIGGVIIVLTVIISFINGAYMPLMISIPMALYFSYRASIHKSVSGAIVLALEEDTFDDD